jgi:cobalt/nickel transport system permease protein
MLSGLVCPVTLAVGGLGVAAAGYAARQSDKQPSPARFAAITSLIFALQMLNFPVQNGTSGHLLGSMLAVSLLGVPFAVLSMAIVLTVQAVFFADGGVNALGANVINMGLLGAGLIGFLWRRARCENNILLAVAAWVSVMAAAAACSIEVAAGGAASVSKVLPAMLSVHALIGLGEAALTVAVVFVIKNIKSSERVAYSAFGFSILAVLLSPMASGFPDGLEWAAQRLSFQEFSAFEFPALFPDYQAIFSSGSALASITAGLIGVAIVSGASFVLRQNSAQTN